MAPCAHLAARLASSHLLSHLTVDFGQAAFLSHCVSGIKVSNHIVSASAMCQSCYQLHLLLFMNVTCVFLFPKATAQLMVHNTNAISV